MTLPRSLLLALLCCTTTAAQQLTADQQAQIDKAMQGVLETTGTPSVSIGISRGGTPVYTRAYGDAVLAERVVPEHPGGGMQPTAMRAPVKAAATMAYPIGSISKQFTAACILLLQERGKLKLDDPVAKWYPDFTAADKVTVRNLLTHTSGYSDYAPQDYTIPAWTKPIKSEDLIREWATKPLDFEPGTKWQYSNTNFQLAALIIQKVSRQSYHDFLWANVITPLKLRDVLDLDTDRGKLQVHGYERHALGPLRPAILEAPGWYTGDGGLAMPVSTLLQWDESIVHGTLLKPESYAEMMKPFVLKDGADSHYGLGVFTQERNGKRVLSHSGEVGGFVSNNIVDVTDDVSLAALTNVEGAGAGPATNAMLRIVLPDMGRRAAPVTEAKPETPPAKPDFDPAPAEQARAILTGMLDGKLDRSLFTEDANYYFSPGTTEDFRTSLTALGPLKSVKQVAEQLRGGMVLRVYQVEFEKQTLQLTTYTQTDGKLEQFLIGT